MSLDLYLTSKKKKGSVSTFVREYGRILELKTVEEVKAHFPDMDKSEIEELWYETEEIYSGNITHNLGEMANHVICNGGENNLYHLLWRPEEHDFCKVTERYRVMIAECLAYMLTHRAELEKFNPSNGWGSYDSLLDFVISLSKELSNWDGEEDVEIYASR